MPAEPIDPAADPTPPAPDATTDPLAAPLVPDRPPPPPLSRAVTLLAALVVLVGVWVLATPGSLESRLAGVRDPERALAIVVGRTMDLHEAIGRTPAWRRWIYVALGFEGADDAGQARQWYDELASVSLDSRVDMHLAILEAETGRRHAVRRRVAEWAKREEPLPSLASLLADAYLVPAADGGTPAAFPGDVLHEWLLEDWFRDRLTLALAARLGEPAVAAAARARLEARGNRLLARLTVLVAITLLIGAIGIVATIVVAIRIRRRRDAVRAGTAAIPPPWSGSRGAAVLLRGGALGTLIGAALLLVLVFALPWLSVRGWEEAAEKLLEFGTGLLLVVPALMLARRHLFRPSGVTAVDALGLRVVPGGASRIVLVVVAVAGVVSVGDVAFGLITDAAGATGHWTEWFQPDLVFGDARDVAMALAGAVVLAPVTEELLFRGLLFASLRRRLAWPIAAVMSAVAFAVLHGYGLQGFASVMWSGLVWAWAFERTGSLWPAVIGHALGNLSASALVLVALRG